MQWLQTLDVELFRWINLKSINPLFDVLMPFLSGNAWFFPLLFVGGMVLIWKGRARGAVCLLMLALILPLNDGFVCNTIKHAVGRPRPFDALAGVHRPASGNTPEMYSPPPETVVWAPGKGPSLNSMPSAHAANWFAAMLIAFVYFRRSLWFMLPLASLVSYSRIYNGVHYPSDVLAGAVLGAGTAVAGLWLFNAAWRLVGQRWFPLWWERLPSLLEPKVREEEEEEPSFAPRGGAASAAPSPHVTLDAHWVRLGYILIALLLLARLAYLASGTIQLQKDEAYQWLWSKHLALSYYSKPPLIAYTQFLGTTLWGDNEFGVRFFSPVISAILSVMVLRFFAREINARAGFFLLLIMTATPLMAVGSILMTVDPLSVLFWTAAMFAGWRAIQDNAGVREWFWVGLWMGLGFLSKPTALFQLLCWAVFFALWPPARRHWRRPGPYLALLVSVLCSLPVLIWNTQHGWIMAQHIANDAAVGKAWSPSDVKHVPEFIGIEALVLNPIFFVATVWAAIVFWRRGRRDPKMVYFFSMGAPLFLAYLAQSFKARVLPNWIAPSILPMFCLMMVYWDARWRLGQARPKGWLVTGLVLGLSIVILGHNTDLVARFDGGHYLPVKFDPLHRVRGWTGEARAAEKEREDLLAEGKPVFIITEDYEMAGILSFYLPEAKACVPDKALVYFRRSPTPINQFYYWPDYSDRKGQNAIFVRELDRVKVETKPAPPQILQEFDSVTDLGVREVMYHGQLCWPLQFFACRGLK
jgi:membrane-associated phospholipid phosphatase